MTRVAALTYPDPDRGLPPRRVAGEHETRWVAPLKYTQHLVGGVPVDPATVRPVTAPAAANIEPFPLPPGYRRGWVPVANAFCPTGPGGGIDPHCSPGEAAAKDPEELATRLRAEAPGQPAPEGRPAKEPLGNDVPRPAADAYAASLTPAQRQALHGYVNADFGLVNGYLRGADVTDPESNAYYESSMDRARGHAAKAHALDSLMTHPLAENLVVYRATKEKRSAYTDHGYPSTTTDRAEAENFAGKFGGKVQRVVVPAGTRVALVGGVGGKGEAEVVLPRGGSFKRQKVSDGGTALVFSPKRV
jgi:hypothetical protein